jgi:hypothetical protein
MLSIMHAREMLVLAGGVCLLLSRHMSAAEPFTEEAQLRGIDYTVMFGGTSGSALAFADLDGDRDADLIVTGASDGHVGVYENDGSGMFTDRSELSGLPVLLVQEASGVIAGDYDSDGDLDLFFSNYSSDDVLARNDGGFQFTILGPSIGIGALGYGTGSAWADYDNDGLLDVYVGNVNAGDPLAPRNRLYHNLGDGTFEEVASLLGVDDDSDTWQAVFFDFDRDADADLYISNDKGGEQCAQNSNHLFENVGGVFKEITDESGTAACIDSMGVAIGDFDGNGYQDLYCTNIPHGNPLFLNQGTGMFVEASDSAGVASFALGWGAHFFDFDNDGHLDLYVCNFVAPNRLYRHEGSWPCVDVAATMGVADAGLSYCLAVADIDNDGDLDIALQNDLERVKLFVNNEGAQHRWARFDVIGEGPSRYAIGANIDIRTGKDWQIREVIAGSNYKGALRFGHGGRDRRARRHVARRGHADTPQPDCQSDLDPLSHRQTWRQRRRRRS